MYTGIVQAVRPLLDVTTYPGHNQFTIDLTPELLDELKIGLARDVARFIGDLPPVLQRYVAILAADNVCEAAREAGLHRSTIYERKEQIRRAAEDWGLAEYLGLIPTVRNRRR